MKENQNTEWKQTWRDEYLKWICGFANAQGGTLVIGRNDKGLVTGIADAARLMEEIPNKMRDILGIVAPVNLYNENGKEWLEIVVEPYPSPISYKGEYHYRSGSTKQELKGAALDKFLLQKRGKRWDSVPVPGFRVSDCSPAAFKLFKTKAAKSGRISEDVLQDDNNSLLENLQLRDGSYLKQAATLLFYDQPEKFVSGAFIKIGFFVTDDDLRYQDEIHGNLFEQVEKTLEILFFKYLKAYISYEGIQRLETFLFPRLALREALLNAVVHKDYSSGIPVQISVYGDRIVLWSPGQLPQDWTIERLLEKHPSAPYNPLIANAFFRAGYIESWGRGIEKINRECREHGISPPRYDYGMSGLMLTFLANPQHLIATFTEQDAKAKQGVAAQKTPVKTPVKISDATAQIGISLSATQETTQETTQEKIMTLLEHQPGITRKVLAVQVGISADGIKYHLEKLKAAGKIRHVGPTKKGHWEIIKNA